MLSRLSRWALAVALLLALGGLAQAQFQRMMLPRQSIRIAAGQRWAPIKANCIDVGRPIPGFHNRYEGIRLDKAVVTRTDLRTGKSETRPLHEQDWVRVYGNGQINSLSATPTNPGPRYEYKIDIPEPGIVGQKPADLVRLPRGFEGSREARAGLEAQRAEYMRRHGADSDLGKAYERMYQKLLWDIGEGWVKPDAWRSAHERFAREAPIAVAEKEAFEQIARELSRTVPPVRPGEAEEMPARPAPRWELTATERGLRLEKPGAGSGERTRAQVEWSGNVAAVEERPRDRDRVAGLLDSAALAAPAERAALLAGAPAVELVLAHQAGGDILFKLHGDGWVRVQSGGKPSEGASAIRVVSADGKTTLFGTLVPGTTAERLLTGVEWVSIAPPRSPGERQVIQLLARPPPDATEITLRRGELSVPGRAEESGAVAFRVGNLPEAVRTDLALLPQLYRPGEAAAVRKAVANKEGTVELAGSVSAVRTPADHRQAAYRFLRSGDFAAAREELVAVRRVQPEAGPETTVVEAATLLGEGRTADALRELGVVRVGEGGKLELTPEGKTALGAAGEKVREALGAQESAPLEAEARLREELLLLVQQGSKASKVKVFREGDRAGTRLLLTDPKTRKATAAEVADSPEAALYVPGSEPGLANQELPTPIDRDTLPLLIRSRKVEVRELLEPGVARDRPTDLGVTEGGRKRSFTRVTEPSRESVQILAALAGAGAASALAAALLGGCDEDDHKDGEGRDGAGKPGAKSHKRPCRVFLVYPVAPADARE